ncbi:Hypothetical protein CINCED_3A019267 [Cinara cedri]|uniref:Uncharacterized protein n=1 Tax=Cinara cedri TaxID=506608 RepID=A0A5E4M6X7_9HEMI|nr:Hypothetical protein CINCED_3A019267 [Cinara cedri]
MVIFNTEYIPELRWIMVDEPHSKKVVDVIDKQIDITLKYKSRNNDKSDIRDLHQHRNNVINDFQSILHLIKLIEKMIKYNEIYYQRIENRRRQQNVELQVLTMFLQNIYNDLKNI